MRKFKVEIDTDEYIGELLRQTTEGRPTSQDRMIVCRTLHHAGLATLTTVESHGNRLMCLYAAADMLRQKLLDEDIVTEFEDEGEED